MIMSIISFWLKKGRTYIVKHPWIKPHFNGNKLIDRTVIKTVMWYFCGLLWMLTAIEMGKTYVCNNIIEEIDAFFVIVETYLTDKWWLNLMITSTCLLSLLFWLKHVLKDRFLSLKRMVIAICIMTILSFMGTFTNVHSAFNIDYATLFWWFLFIQLILDFVKLWYKRWNVKAPGKSRLKYLKRILMRKLGRIMQRECRNGYLIRTLVRVPLL